MASIIHYRLIIIQKSIYPHSSMEGNKKMDQRRIIDTGEKKIKHRKWQYIIYSNYKLQSKHSSFVRQNTHNTTQERKKERT